MLPLGSCVPRAACLIDATELCKWWLTGPGWPWHGSCFHILQRITKMAISDLEGYLLCGQFWFPGGKFWWKFIFLKIHPFHLLIKEWRAHKSLSRIFRGWRIYCCLEVSDQTIPTTQRQTKPGDIHLPCHTLAFLDKPSLTASSASPRQQKQPVLKDLQSSPTFFSLGLWIMATVGIMDGNLQPHSGWELLHPWTALQEKGARRLNMGSTTLSLCLIWAVSGVVHQCFCPESHMCFYRPNGINSFFLCIR